MKVLVLGPGGVDPSKSNNNIVSERLLDSPVDALDPINENDVPPADLREASALRERNANGHPD